MDSQRGTFPVTLLPHEVRARFLTKVGGVFGAERKAAWERDLLVQAN